MIKNKFFYINLLLFILAFIFISYEIRYACIYGDDIVDFFPYNWYFFHGRIITELVSVFLIKTLPSVLHIHIQNFALFSETVFKALIYCSVVYVISHSYNKFKQANILFSCSMILSFFVICAILVQNDFTAHIVKMNEYYNGYITAALFYLL